jgi:DNA-binding IclR family transcriptional regulator
VDTLIEAAREDMERINAELAEAVSLAALFDDHVRVVHTLESSREIRMSNYLSRILSPYASSLGKAIAAYQDPAVFNRLLQVYGIYPITARTIIEPTQIQEEMARTRERGFSAEFEETVVGGCCFGAPIRMSDQEVRAAISVSLPVARLTDRLESTLGDIVKDAAARIEKRVNSGQLRTRAKR